MTKTLERLNQVLGSIVSANVFVLQHQAINVHEIDFAIVIS